MVETKTKNWPPCYPLIYHDIQAEILESSAVGMAELSYKLWLAYIVTLIFNLVAVIASAASAGAGIGFLYGGGGGLKAMINNFQHDPPFLVAGVFSAICVFLVLSLTMFHFILFRKVYKHFKSAHDDWTIIPGTKK
ncbi:5075_t:CDS:2 [Rhizophagus irregularis]|nr:5075_t:CDS:2 [Rhizophagus irregularis]